MSDTPTFYLLYGDDDLAIEEQVKAMRASMGDGPNADMNISEYDGEAVSVAKVLNDVRSYPFLADKRLVIVKGMVNALMRTNAGKEDLERLIADVPTLPAHARLVLVEREKLRSDLRIVKTARDKGFCREYAVPENTSDWIRQRVKSEYGAQIDPAAAEALASVTGNDLRRADNEIIKLITYVDGERPISEADVALLTPYVADASVFDMVDALAEGNGRTALSLMNTVLEQEPGDPGFRLFSMIARQFRLLMLVREHLDSGGSAKNTDIARILKIHPFPAGKLAVQSRRFSLAQLEKIYRTLQQNDVDMKTGRIEPRLALELLVASLGKK